MKPRLVAPILILVILTGCAGSIRDNFRRAALISGEVALGIDQTERDVYATGVYDDATHKKIGAAILVMLKAVRVYERAVAAWPESFSMPPDVPTALADAIAAINNVERIIEGIPGTGKLTANLNRIKAALGGK